MGENLAITTANTPAEEIGIYKLVSAAFNSGVTSLTLGVSHRDGDNSLVYDENDGEIIFSIHRDAVHLKEGNQISVYDQTEGQARFFIVTGSNSENPGEDGYYTFTALGMVDPRQAWPADDDDADGESSSGDQISGE